MPKSKSTTLPTLAILATTVVWGTWWIPLRNLDAISGGNALVVGSGILISLLVMLPVLLIHHKRIAAAGTPLILSALFFGCALALYAEGMLRGQIARVILFFYLTPVWSTLLARAMLGKLITRRRVVTILLGLAGLLVILDIDASLYNIGDFLGLISGISWGLAMVYTQRLPSHPLADKVALQFVFATAIFFALTLIPGGREWSVIILSDLNLTAITWILAFAFIWNLPVVWLTFYGGAHIEPGRVAILLMLEVVIGIVTASLFTDEVFGLREMMGATLIIAAGCTEFIHFGKRELARK